jgi:phage terminase small subunit
MEQRRRRCEISADQIIEEYKRVAFQDVRRLVDDEGNYKEINQLDQETAAGIARIEVSNIMDDSGQRHRIRKIHCYDKTKALEALARIEAMFKDRVEHSGSINGMSEEALNDKIKALQDEIEGDLGV